MQEKSLIGRMDGWMERIHDKGEHQQAPDHADVHLPRGLSQAVVQLRYQIDHGGSHREIHQPLELWEVVQRWRRGGEKSRQSQLDAHNMKRLSWGVWTGPAFT